MRFTLGGLSFGIGVFALVLGLFLAAGLNARAQTAADVQAAADKACAVMSGQQKADSHTLQILLMLDGDMADANPVELALYKDVVHECPKAYLAYEQRLRANNPLGGLVKGQSNLTSTGTSLTTPASSAPEYPIRCRGAAGMATSSGATLIVTFARTAQSASGGLQPGQCAWLDRAVRSGEPAKIDVPLASAAQSKNGVAQINAGGLWTFWVVNAKTSLRATAVAKGTPAQKP